VTSSLDTKKVTVEDILVATAQMSGFTVGALLGPDRHRRLVEARHIAIYVARTRTDLSYPAIARAFNREDHTTVMHAVNKIAELVFRGDMRTCRQLAGLGARLDATEIAR
jgi:chromosomal replication initiator protein